MNSISDVLRRRQEGGEGTELRVIYLNGRRGRRQAEVALQIGSDKKAEAVVIAEALSDQTKRPNHRTYNLAWNSKYLSVHTRRDKHMWVEGRGNGT